MILARTARGFEDVVGRILPEIFADLVQRLKRGLDLGGEDVCIELDLAVAVIAPAHSDGTADYFAVEAQRHFAARANGGAAEEAKRSDGSDGDANFRFSHARIYGRPEATFAPR